MLESAQEDKTSLQPGPDSDRDPGGDDKPRRDGPARPGNGRSGGDRKHEPATSSPLKKWTIRILLVVGVVLVLIAAGLWLHNWWTHGRFVQSTNDAYLQADQVAVSTRVAGIVEKVFVSDNQAVNAGQPLVRLDDRDPRARLEQALAQVDLGQANIAQAEAEISQQEARIAQAQAQLGAAQSQARFADREQARYTRLAASGAEASERADQMRQNGDQAHAQVAQNAAAVLVAQRQIETLRAQVMQGRAQIELAQAQARQAQVDLDATLVRASIDGRVGDRTVRVGAYLQPGTPMMSVVPVADIYLIANFKETQVGLMRAGQPATVSVDALASRALHGAVESFAPGTGAQFALIPPSNATGNFTKIVQRIPVRIRIEAAPDADKVLVPGMSVTVAVDTIGSKRDAQKNEQEGGAAADRRMVQRAEAVGTDRADRDGAGK
jgi:membrane fusion protein (multidrug efflux system)